MFVEYSCSDCYNKEGAVRRLIPIEEYKPKEKFYCILCGEEMPVYTGMNDDELESLLNGKEE